MNKTKFLILFFVLVVLLNSVAFSASAALPNLDGYAPLQDGSTNFGHIAIFYKDGFISNNDGIRTFNNSGQCTNYFSNAVMEVHSISQPIADYGNYNDFRAGFDFLGYYRPINPDNNGNSQLLTASKKNDVKLTAQNIINAIRDGQVIYYTLMNQIDHNASAGTIYISDIENLRCDGYVEYCYEYNGVRICGPDTKWNISKVASTSWHNNSVNANPKIQAYDYMQNMLGDMDADGDVDAADAQKALRISAGLDQANFYQEKVGDTNADGDVDAADAQYLLRYSAGLETYFPGDPVITHPIAF